MGHRQRAIGLDRLPLANGGRAAEVFRQGGSCRDGQVDQDPGELEGIKQGLGVRSALLCPLVVAAERRGVLIAASAGAEQFSADDLSFFDAVAGWVGLVLHRAELVERLVEQGEQRGQRQAMAELLNVLTPRQREVAVCIARGYSNEEIAERLCITPGTAANHVERILRRLSFRSRTEVAALVAEIGVHRQDPEALEQAS
jgi:RNA polymerase sigma factor (sigma-70 family)